MIKLIKCVSIEAGQINHELNWPDKYNHDLKTIWPLARLNWPCHEQIYHGKKTVGFSAF